MSAVTESYNFVAVGLPPEVKSLVESLVEKSSVKYVDSFGAFEDLIETFELAGEARILVGDAITAIEPVEFGQALRATFITAQLAFVTAQKDSFSPYDLKKNGFSSVYFLPMDRGYLTEFISLATLGSIKKSFKAIKIVDLRPNEELDFGVYTYMPRNKKFLLLTAEGKISEKKFQALQDNLQRTLYVETQQMDKFYDYAAKKLAELSSPEGSQISETEREQRFKQHIQELFHNILDHRGPSDFKWGRDLMDQSHQVVQRFVELKTGLNIAEQIQEILNPHADSYSHAQAVSSLACLLSMALEIGEPEDLALAGLFHDIGIEGFETDPDHLALDKLTPEELERYKSHPLRAVHVLKSKKMTLPPAVAQIIEQHHERVDGRGFPRGLPAHKISLDAHLLAFTDLFEYMMRPSENRKALTPFEAIDKIEREYGLHAEVIQKVRAYLKSALTFKEAS